MKTISILLVLLAAAVLPAPVKADDDPIGQILSEAAEVYTSGNNTCAITTSGGVKCWGFWRLDHLVWQYLTSPEVIPGWEENITSLALGDNHVCALTVGGGVECWGSWSMLGDGLLTYSYIPVQVSGLNSGVKAIAASNYTTCAITSSGSVKCWGSISICNYDVAATPYTPSGLSENVESISMGDYHSCAVLSGSGIKCWGTNTNYVLGNGENGGECLAPVNVIGFANVRTYMPILLR